MLALVKNHGMTDEQRNNEWGCQKRLQAAIIEMQQALEMVNDASAVETVKMSEWQDFLHDSVPDFGQWDEKISAARIG